MSAAVASIVTLCACSHAERMHERDTAAEHDRGVCMHGSCGCAEYRPGDTQRVDPTQGEAVEPVSEAQAAAPLQSVAAPAGRIPCEFDGCDKTFTQQGNMRRHVTEVHEQGGRLATKPGQMQCPDCDRSFAGAGGLATHRGMTHKPDPDYSQIVADIAAKQGPPEAAKEGQPSHDGDSAPAASITPDNDARLASSGTAIPPGESAGSVGDAPNLAADRIAQADPIPPGVADELIDALRVTLDQMRWDYFRLLMDRAENTELASELWPLLDRIERLIAHIRADITAERNPA